MKGFIKIRRGLEEHLIAGSLSLFDVGVFLVILLQANFETGIWRGSAARLRAAAPRGATLRDVQRSLERLRKIGFIKVFHVRGQRGNYSCLINRYQPEFGALRGKRLNADASTSWKSPVYEACADADAEAAQTPR
jgi:hypothetical protein